jgi:cell division protein FtsZ
MGSDIKVTVVATGIGDLIRKPTIAVDNTPANPVPCDANGEVDYGGLDRPTVTRRQGQVAAGAAQSTENLDYLDVPAFIRKQAD